MKRVVKGLSSGFAALVLIGCGGPGGSSNSGAPPVTEESVERLACRSQDVVTKCGRCLVMATNRVANIANEIALLPQPHRDAVWFPIWFDLKSVRKRYNLSQEEATCLKRQFCSKEEL